MPGTVSDTTGGARDICTISQRKLKNYLSHRSAWGCTLYTPPTHRLEIHPHGCPNSNDLVTPQKPPRGPLQVPCLRPTPHPPLQLFTPPVPMTIPHPRGNSCRWRETGRSEGAPPCVMGRARSWAAFRSRAKPPGLLQGEGNSSSSAHLQGEHSLRAPGNHPLRSA